MLKLFATATFLGFFAIVSLRATIGVSVLTDVGEFLTMLVACVLFTAAILREEKISLDDARKHAVMENTKEENAT